jgi:hypothetical protein
MVHRMITSSSSFPLSVQIRPPLAAFMSFIIHHLLSKIKDLTSSEACDLSKRHVRHALVFLRVLSKMKSVMIMSNRRGWTRHLLCASATGINTTSLTAPDLHFFLNSLFVKIKSLTPLTHVICPRSIIKAFMSSCALLFSAKLDLHPFTHNIPLSKTKMEALLDHAGLPKRDVDMLHVLRAALSRFILSVCMSSLKFTPSLDLVECWVENAEAMLNMYGSNGYKYLTLAGLDLRFFIYILPYLTMFDAPARIPSLHHRGARD